MRTSCLAGLAALIACTSAVAQPREYTITNIGRLTDDNILQVYDISDSGYLVGHGSSRAHPLIGTYAFRWRDSRMVATIPPPNQWLWPNSNARGVNDAGQVVGRFGDGTFWVDRGFSWDGGTATMLSGPFGPNVFPARINNSGEIVGQTSGPQAIYWNRNLEGVALEGFVDARDINDAGQIVVQNADDEHASLYDHGQVTHLGTLGGTRTSARAINAHGHITGHSMANNGVMRAFVWKRETGMVELLDMGFPDRTTEAYDINDDGFIVGAVSVASGLKPAIWSPDLVPHLLEDLVPRRWAHMSFPSAINSYGQIVGTGVIGDPNIPFAGYLLTPANLELSAPSPGFAGTMNSVTITNVAEGARVDLVASLEFGETDEGYRRIPGCGGIGVSMPSPHLVGSAIAGTEGATIRFFVPMRGAGRAVRVQAFDRTGCEVSNVVGHSF